MLGRAAAGLLEKFSGGAAATEPVSPSAASFAADGGPGERAAGALLAHGIARGSSLFFATDETDEAGAGARGKAAWAGMSAAAEAAAARAALKLLHVPRLLMLYERMQVHPIPPHNLHRFHKVYIPFFTVFNRVPVCTPFLQRLNTVFNCLHIPHPMHSHPHTLHTYPHTPPRPNPIATCTPPNLPLERLLGDCGGRDGARLGSFDDPFTTIHTPSLYSIPVSCTPPYRSLQAVCRSSVFSAAAEGRDCARRGSLDDLRESIVGRATELRALTDKRARMAKHKAH